MNKPKCELVGEDGNIFNLLGKVRKTLKRNGQRDKVREVTERVQQSESYDEALRILMDYVEII